MKVFEGRKVVKLEVAKEDVWAADIKDCPGGLAEKLSALSAAGADLGFVIARRKPEKKGHGVVFVTPLKGVKQAAAAKKAGFAKTAGLHGVCVSCADKPGIGARITSAVGEAGISIRGLSAAALGEKCIAHLAFDSADDAKKAMRTLRALK